MKRAVADCLRGLVPADALSTVDRAAVVARLHGDGLTDGEIAEITRLTTYTTGRIRARLGLAAHERKTAHALVQR
ncbi:hypothetical protein [Amycolatopsis echigonensis]|uniref:Uncharacterized protein n=1 Tax=Amycolatopsis echigonensis TaxID=2576905 RepID=A0A8E1W2J3_9PSEU|nr:hypothetical protein [Amycolatopsis echigonensis]MBB2502930.1 hypothetical protein [Amycolatopsis echigonensis]